MQVLVRHNHMHYLLYFHTFLNMYASREFNVINSGTVIATCNDYPRKKLNSYPGLHMVTYGYSGLLALLKATSTRIPSNLEGEYLFCS